MYLTQLEELPAKASNRFSSRRETDRYMINSITCAKFWKE
jgi:hypothetical protein